MTYLPLTLLGAPVSIGALLKPGSRSLGKAKTETGRNRPPGTKSKKNSPKETGPHVPFRYNWGSAAIHPSRSRG